MKHECMHKDEIESLTKKVGRTSNKVTTLLVFISVFLALTLFAVANAASASTGTNENSRRIDVQEERFIWIKKAIERMEKKLDRRRP